MIKVNFFELLRKVYKMLDDEVVMSCDVWLEDKKNKEKKEKYEKVKNEREVIIKLMKACSVLSVLNEKSCQCKKELNTDNPEK